MLYDICTHSFFTVIKPSLCFESFNFNDFRFKKCKTLLFKFSFVFKKITTNKCIFNSFVFKAVVVVNYILFIYEQK